MALKEMVDENTEHSDFEAYAESTPLTWLFGNHPRTKIIAALRSEIGNSLYLDDISILAGISERKAKSEISQLREFGIVLRSNKHEDEPKYKINEDSEITKLAMEIEDRLLHEWYKSQD